MPDGIARERELLADLRDLADQVIDTSQLNVHDLKRLVMARFARVRRLGPEPHRHLLRLPVRRPAAGRPGLRRALPAQPVLRPRAQAAHRARTRGWRATCSSGPRPRSSSSRIVDLAQFLFPRYQREGKAYLTVALGLHRREAPERRGGGRPRPAPRGRPGRGAAPAPGHREGVGEQARARGRCSRPVTGAQKLRRGSFQPRGPRWTPAGPPPISVLFFRWHVKIRCAAVCRMVAAHGGVGVGAAADCREVSTWSGSWSQPMVVWRRSWWRPPNRSWGLCPRWPR